MKKFCRQCKRFRGLQWFNIQASCADGRHPICTTCQNENSKPARALKKKEHDWLRQFSPV